MSAVPPTNISQPKIVHKLIIRTVMAVVAMGVLFAGLNLWKDYSQDPSRVKKADTSDNIAAISFGDNGQQAVVIRPNGEILRSPEYVAGKTERDLAWSPEGHHLYYVSDRDKDTFQVYRWRPTPDGESEARTIGSRGKSYPSFPGGDAKNETLLMASGGTVLRLDPVKRTTKQLLPPPSTDITVSNEEGGGGSVSPFSAAYGELGESFRTARYLPGQHKIAAVMRRDRGEVLIVQSEAARGERPEPPRPIISGDRIDFDVTPDGKIVFSLLNFQWLGEVPPAFIKNGKATVPYKFGVGIYDPKTSQPVMVMNSMRNDAAYGNVAISPDGSRLLLVVGSFDGTNFLSQGMILVPLQPNSAADRPALLVKGEVFEPAWHPSGKKIVFVRRVDGHRSIFTVNDEGFEEKNLTEGKGDFGTPKFSPQVATTP